MASRRGSSEGRLLDWKRRSGACVPEKDLPTVGSANYEGWMKWREFGSQYVGCAVEGIFWA